MKHRFVSGVLIEVAGIFAYRAVSLHRGACPARLLNLPTRSNHDPGRVEEPRIDRHDSA